MGHACLCQVINTILISWHTPTLANHVSFTFVPHSRHPSLSAGWKQIWQLGMRLVSMPSTSRAACALLHAIMKAALITSRDVADDINQIVTTADISGPAVIVDSSLNLMLSMLQARNTLFPNTSQSTCSLIIRWIFVKWNPGK